MSILFPAGADADVGHAAARPMPQSGWSWLVLRLVRCAPYGDSFGILVNELGPVIQPAYMLLVVGDTTSRV